MMAHRGRGGSIFLRGEALGAAVWRISIISAGFEEGL